MTSSGWTAADSPFHAGELNIQERLGYRERIDQQGRRMIRNYLVEQHRQFFARLAYVMVGTVDAAGQPWTSLLVGTPGFLSTPDNKTLRVDAQLFSGDPLNETLRVGQDIGFLGIELQSRRRNRINGTISTVEGDRFEVEVKQSFGNCPQYIQARSVCEASPTDYDRADSVLEKEFSAFSTDEKQLITTADTFFITTAYQSEKAGLASGVDVSHRGGKPGFVRVDEDNKTLMIPDFAGNHHFNTFGNIALNPRSGLLFIDFEQGDLLYLTGAAEVIWEGPEVDDYEGAERLLRFGLVQGHRLSGGLPMQWSDPAFSPYLEHTGIWPSGAKS